jgi:uncharacterized protein (DUF4415 family)
MSENKRDTKFWLEVISAPEGWEMPEPRGYDAEGRPIFSDLARVDAHEITPEEYEEIPEITEEMMANATWYDGEGRVIRKNGRPVSANPREQVTIRIPRDLLAKWRATGPGWQTRMVERLHLD